ncbi:MAG: PQQ-binding-like beta-propeller repeat protein, partial [bacterium]
MNSPKPNSSLFPFNLFLRLLAGAFLVAAFGSLPACGGKLVKETSAEPVAERPAPPPSDFPAWLGNGERKFYGTGPWEEGPLEVVWENKTGLISGRLHKDGWGGTSWPGQPSVAGDRVYFPSADGNVYCVNL